MRWIRAAWPTSLLGRTFALLSLVLVFGAIGWTGAFRYHQMEPRATQAATFVVSVVNLTRSALTSAQPELLQNLLREFSDYEGIRIYPADLTDQPIDSAPDDYLEMVMTQVRKELGQSTRFALMHEKTPGFFVSFSIDDDQYWAEFPLARVRPTGSDQWIRWASGGLALSLFLLYLIVYRIRAPLAALTGAARTLGRGEYPGSLAIEGPSELRALAVAFNQMTRDLARLESDRALILAGVSHDLRTPLARLRLAIEMSPIDPASREAMVGDIEEMNRIVGQFLDFARALTGEKAQSLSLSTLAQELTESYSRRALRIESSIQPTPAQWLRPIALRRLMSNLIDNALRYGEAPIELVVRRDDREVFIEVMDRGPGIPPDAVERLRQPFQRLENARSNTGGSGLGLAIVDRIAKAHGGSLELLARDGGGLVARVTLPRT
jgi:two-component system osmolarity sensor histidine kinase EnvZ